jgi:hypothetical protein
LLPFSIVVCICLLSLYELFRSLVTFDDRGNPLPPDVIHREPANIPVWYKGLIVFVVLTLIGVFVFDAIILDAMWFIAVGVAMAIFMIVIFTIVTPSYMDITVSDIT